MCGRGRDLYQPHPRGCDSRERAGDVGRLRQPAQGCGAERDPDRRVSDQPQAHPGEEEGGVGTEAEFVMPAHSASKTRVNALMSRASTSFAACKAWMAGTSPANISRPNSHREPESVALGRIRKWSRHACMNAARDRGAGEC